MKRALALSSLFLLVPATVLAAQAGGGGYEGDSCSLAAGVFLLVVGGVLKFRRSR
jgi:hypothetical protein